MKLIVRWRLGVQARRAPACKVPSGAADEESGVTASFDDPARCNGGDGWQVQHALEIFVCSICFPRLFEVLSPNCVYVCDRGTLLGSIHKSRLVTRGWTGQ